MKSTFTFYKTFLLLFIISGLIELQTVKATTYTVSVANNSFTPSSIAVFVGDSVKWIWSAGNHTTTSLTIPASAASWNHAMASASDVFVYPVLIAGTYTYACSVHGTTMSGGFTASNASAGTSRLINESLATVYPNPVNETLNIRLNRQFSGQCAFTVCDILGNELISQNVQVASGQNNLVIDIADLHKGMYFLKISGTGREPQVIKVSKE